MAEVVLLDEFISRNYQVELMKIALKQNTVIYLTTGSGKKYIALLVLKQLSASILQPWHNGGKVSIILVTTITLVHQRAQYLQSHTNFRVGSYTPELNVDLWNHEVWTRECSEHEVLIMTCKILTDAVERSYLSLERVNLLIFEECHRGVNDHVVRQLMKSFQHIVEQPRVLGLTATLLNGNCKPYQVKSQVQNLETTYHSKVATIDELSVVMGYSKNPREIIQHYSMHVTTPTEQEGIIVLKRLKTILLSLDSEDCSLKRRNFMPLKTNNSVKDLYNLIEDIIYHIHEFGSFGGVKAVLAHTIQMERIKKYCSDRKMYTIMNCIITDFMVVKKILQREMSGNVKEDIFKFSSPKVKAVFDLIKNYKNLCDEELCSIIFVQRRFTANVLFQVLKCLTENFAEYSFIKPNFIVGYNSNPHNQIRESMYFKKVNREIIQKFYLKDINLICSSNILEEGVDVPKCSLVVKFDQPMGYRDYAQSKGRARDKNSLYYIMVQEGENSTKFCKRYKTFQEIELELNKYLIGQNE